MYVYLDETEFGEGKYSGYASLITEKRIGQEVIDDALKNLEDDPDRFQEPQKTMDDRTLARGYFHAADDSKNAHSHLCNSINKHVLGNFKSHTFHTDSLNFKNTEDAYDLASKLSVVGLFSKTRELTFIFEGRNGLSAKLLLERWWPALWKSLSQNCFSAPFIVKYYPKVKFEISDKSDPGSQVVDFILWSSQRATYVKDDRWYNRLEGWAKSTTSAIGEGWEGHSLTRIPPEDLNCRRYDIEDAVRKTSLLDGENDLPMILFNVQRVCNISHSNTDRTFISHFYEEVDYIVKNRVVQHDMTFIIKMADCFIKLFDNIHLIESPLVS